MPARRRWKCCRAPKRSMPSSSAKPKRTAVRICRCASASGSILGPAWSAIWDPIVLGDTVNLASRLESRTKDYRIPVVIGSRTAEGAEKNFAVMEIDLIMVEGKKQPEAVFTVLGPAEVQADQRCKDLRDANAQMLARFRNQQWDEAAGLIARCRKFANGFDLSGLYDMYEERIELYRAQPPGADWDGVYEAETK